MFVDAGNFSPPSTGTGSHKNNLVLCATRLAVQRFGRRLRMKQFGIDCERKVFRLDAVALEAFHQTALPHPQNAVLPEHFDQIAAERGGFPRVPADADVGIVGIMIYERRAGGLPDLANRLRMENGHLTAETSPGRQ